MNQFYLFFTFLFLFSFSGIAQTHDLDHYVIGSDGDHSSNNQFSLDYTIGEVVTEYGQDAANTVHLTQGFQQTLLAILSVEDHVEDIEINVYPNPAVDHLNVRIPTISKDMEYALFDMGGKLIKKESVQSQEFQIGFSTFSTGNYLLVFTNKDQRLKTLQVQKSH